MAITVEAVYKNGQLKLKEPLTLAEGTAVRVTITPAREDDPFADIIGICHSGRRDGAANHDKYLKRKRPR
jgi:predicted DNA-binding antitoxin AbrB/MazE fold protein